MLNCTRKSVETGAAIMVAHRPIESDDGELLVTRRAAAYWLKRHPDHIRKHAQPVACRVADRWPLYRLSDLEQRFGDDTPRRRHLTRQAS